GERALVEGDAGLLPELVDDEVPALHVGLEAADEAALVEERADVVAPAALGGGLVDLPDVLEAEDVLGEAAVPDERVERPEETHPAVVVRVAALEEARRGEIAALQARDLDLVEG